MHYIFLITFQSMHILNFTNYSSQALLPITIHIYTAYLIYTLLLPASLTSFSATFYFIIYFMGGFKYRPFVKLPKTCNLNINHYKILQIRESDNLYFFLYQQHNCAKVYLYPVSLTIYRRVVVYLLLELSLYEQVLVYQKQLVQSYQLIKNLMI